MDGVLCVGGFGGCGLDGNGSCGAFVGFVEVKPFPGSTILSFFIFEGFFKDISILKFLLSLFF